MLKYLLNKVMASVFYGEMFITADSRTFEVPRKTPDDRVEGTVLSSEEEKIADRVPPLYGKLWFSLNANNGQSFRMGHC